MFHPNKTWRRQFDLMTSSTIMTTPSRSSMAAASLITPMLICKDEEANIGRSLERLTWAAQVLLIDSGSTDNTLAIADSFKNVQVLQRPFDSFARQCNFGISNIASPWILSLDADYVLTPEFVTGLDSFSPPDDVWGYRITLRYCIYGRPLRGTLLPPRVCLYRREGALYRDEGHGHRLNVAGHVVDYSAEILHDDRKSLARWLDSQRRYQLREAEMLLTTPVSALKRYDRLRRTTLLMPILALPYCLIVKQGLLDGWRGWFYAFQRVYAELQLSLILLDAIHGDQDTTK
ncbi:MAG: glycosyltransferase family 2 protein [Synechococcaceae cyanobacterium]